MTLLEKMINYNKRFVALLEEAKADGLGLYIDPQNMLMDNKLEVTTCLTDLCEDRNQFLTNYAWFDIIDP